MRPTMDKYSSNIIGYVMVNNSQSDPLIYTMKRQGMVMAFSREINNQLIFTACQPICHLTIMHSDIKKKQHFPYSWISSVDIVYSTRWKNTESKYGLVTQEYDRTIRSGMHDNDVSLRNALLPALVS